MNYSSDFNVPFRRDSRSGGMVVWEGWSFERDSRLGGIVVREGWSLGRDSRLAIPE